VERRPCYGMHTLEPTAYRHSMLSIASDRPTEFIDVTERIQALVVASGIHTGFVNIQTLHTTTAIVVNEHEPLLIGDFAAQLERTAPRDARYQHDDATVRTVNLTPGERPNGHAHCRALFLSPSAMLNVACGRVRLGRWQRIFVVELDGPRTREISVVVCGEAVR
jgi:secondary thiamine-phosphate synthase enzyme